MKQILIYSDSLSWGIIPDTRQRLPFDKRWPGIFEGALQAKGKKVRIIENCLNGRRTAWEDPFKEGRNGSDGLAQAVEMNSPLSLVVLALGTNDFQDTDDHDAWLSGQGLARLVNTIRHAQVEEGMPKPKIMIVAPPPILQPKGVLMKKFKGAETRCVGMVDEYKRIAKEHATYFFDIGSVTEASTVDGIHLDEGQHVIVGESIAAMVAESIVL